MATIADARDGLDALLLDKGARLTLNEKDSHLRSATRMFSRRLPRVISKEIAGDGGFDYALPTDFTANFSVIKSIHYPFDVSFQNPNKLESKDYTIFESETAGRRLRFLTTAPSASDKFLVRFTALHTFNPDAVLDVVGTLFAAGTNVSGDLASAAVDVEAAKGARIFLHVTAAGTSAEYVVETSSDGVRWSSVAQSPDPLTATGDLVELLEKQNVSKFVRLRFFNVTGTFTLEAVVESEGPGATTFTVPDHQLDAFSFLSASIAAKALANFYASTVESAMANDTTDYEGKSTFWQENARVWREDFDKELLKLAQSDRKATPFAQGEWDLRGSTGFRLLTHEERFR